MELKLRVENQVDNICSNELRKDKDTAGTMEPQKERTGATAQKEAHIRVFPMRKQNKRLEDGSKDKMLPA